MLSSSIHLTSALTVDLSCCAEFPDVFEPPSGLPPKRDIEHKIYLLYPNVLIQNYYQYHLKKQELDEVHK